jgi:hypothetical protein
MGILNLMRITKLGLYNPFLFFIFALLISFYFLSDYIAFERPILFNGGFSITMAFITFFYFLILDLFYINKINNVLNKASNDVFNTNGKYKEFILSEALKTFLNDIGGVKFLKSVVLYPKIFSSDNEYSLFNRIEKIIRVEHRKFKTTLDVIIKKGE